MDTIIVRDLHVPLVIGYLPEERTKIQDIFITIKIGFRRESQDDAIETVVNYVPVTREITKQLQEAKPHLIETAAEIVATISLEHTLAKEVCVEITKPSVLPSGTPGVCIFRKK